MTAPDPNVVQRALAALRTQETFTRDQVAFLLDLAIRAATADEADDQVAVDLAYRSGYAAGLEAGEEQAYAEVHRDLRYALGGPAAKTMKDAVRTAICSMEQKQARDDWTRRASEPTAPSVIADDPDWPPVTLPGHWTNEPTHADQHNRPASVGHLQRVA